MDYRKIPRRRRASRAISRTFPPGYIYIYTCSVRLQLCVCMPFDLITFIRVDQKCVTAMASPLPTALRCTCISLLCMYTCSVRLPSRLDLLRSRSKMCCLERWPFSICPEMHWYLESFGSATRWGGGQYYVTLHHSVYYALIYIHVYTCRNNIYIIPLYNIYTNNFKTRSCAYHIPQSTKICEE